jgi:L-threonylcarbamoyladenylate synthase
VARALLEASQCPIAAPSANRFGYLSPTTAEHVDAGLGNAVPWILDGGPCPGGIESTIVDVSGERPALLRAGGVAAEEIESLIGPLCRPDGGDVPLAPGQLPSHYAPRIPLVLLKGRAVSPPATAGRLGLLAFEEPPPSVSVAFRAVEILSPSGSVVEAAARLFSCLHRLDALDLDAIQVEPVPESGVGAAVMDRLRRGAAQRVPPVRPED